MLPTPAASASPPAAAAAAAAAAASPLPDFQVQDVVFSDTVPLASPRLRDELRDDELLAEAERLAAQPPLRKLTASVFGRCADGTDVCVHVAGFRPELYYDGSADVGVVKQRCRRLGPAHADVAVDRVQRYDGGSLRLDAEGRRVPRPYWRVRFPTVRAFTSERYQKDAPAAHHTLPPLESHFFRHTRTTPSGWARLLFSAGGRRGSGGDAGVRRAVARATHCTHEWHADSPAALVGVPDVDAIAPLVVGALDIEAVSATGEFPDATRLHDVICTVGLVVWAAGSPLSTPPRRHVVTLRSCDAIDGVRVHACETEAEVLLATRDALIDEGVDVLVQFYGFAFDLPYLSQRAAASGCDGFEYLGKMRFQPTKLKLKTLISSGAGENHMSYFPMAGRANFDFFLWYKLNYKRPTYGLNAIAQEWTGEAKMDFAYDRIGPAYHGSSAERAEMAAYCVQDCELLRAIMERLQTMADQVEQSRVCRVVLERLNTHGQSVKVNAQLDDMCTRIVDLGLVDLPFVLDNHFPGGSAAGAGGDAEATSFVGAFVVEPKRGYHRDHPVIVLDYGSLYPSLMIKHNMCKSTLVRAAEDEAKPGVTTRDIGDGTLVRFATRAPGLMPMLLQNTLRAREQVKKQAKRLAAHRDELLAAGRGGDAEAAALLERYMVLDKRQLALKVSANSVYGYMGGCTEGSDRRVAAAVTAAGREALKSAVNISTERARSLTRESDGAPVGDLTLVYGDSVSADTPILLLMWSTEPGGAEPHPLRGIPVSTTFRELDDKLRWFRMGEGAGEDAGEGAGEGEGKQWAHSCCAAWTERGWVPIRAILRHRVGPTKRMFRVHTAEGVVDVTEDHSLVRASGAPLAAGLAQPGDSLLHSCARGWKAVCTGDEGEEHRAWAELCGLLVSYAAVVIERDTATAAETMMVSLLLPSLAAASYAKQTAVRAGFPHLVLLSTDGLRVDLVPARHRVEGETFVRRCVRPCLVGGPRVPSAILAERPLLKVHFVRGLQLGTPFGDSAALELRGALAAHGVYALLGSLQIRSHVVAPVATSDAGTATWTLVVDVDEGASLKWLDDPCDVLCVEELPAPDAGEYVYDISTGAAGNEHFGAVGVGRVVLHNTDSIMVELANVTTPEDAYPAGEDLSLSVTAALADPDEDATGQDPTKKKPRLVFEMEKVYFPSIFFAKKCYVGDKFERNKFGAVVCVGLSQSGTVSGRRDYCAAVQTLYTTMLNALIKERSAERCLALFHAHMRALVHGLYDFEQMLLTKGVKAANKTDNLPQLRVVAKQKERAPGSETRAGNRLELVYVEGDAKAQRNDLAEDAAYARAHNLRIDVASYLDAQYRTPCESILDLIDPQALGLIDAYKQLAQQRRQGIRDPRHFLGRACASASASGEGVPSAGEDKEVVEGEEERRRVERMAREILRIKEKRKRPAPPSAGGKAPTKAPAKAPTKAPAKAPAGNGGGMSKWFKK